MKGEVNMRFVKIGGKQYIVVTKEDNEQNVHEILEDAITHKNVTKS